MYRNNTSPWLQKHNAAVSHKQHGQNYRMNLNVYNMIIVVGFPSVFPSADLLQFLNYSMLFPGLSFTQPSAIANLHTPTQGHVLMCY